MKKCYTLEVVLLILLFCVWLCQKEISWYKRIVLIAGILLCLFCATFHYYRNNAKTVTNVKWKPGMVFMTFPTASQKYYPFLRLSGMYYLHAAVVYEENGKLGVMELNLTVIKPRHDPDNMKTVHSSNDHYFPFIVNKYYSIDYYLNYYKESSGDFVFRIYDPPSDITTLPYSHDKVLEICKTNPIDCLTFIYQYLMMHGHINDGVQMLHPILRHTPITLHNRLIERGWEYDIYSIL